MSLPQFDITGKKVLITGAGRGIGKGIALVMAEAGADVAVTALSEANALRVAEEVRARGVKGYGWAADATRLAEMEALAQRVLEAMGGIDVLINGVGDAIPGSISSLPEGGRRVLSEADWHKIIDLNLTQAFTGCQVFGPQLLRKPGSCVINISSFAAVRPEASMAAYAAAKAGLSRLTESLALEWAPFGVRVNAIAPGVFPDPEQLTPEQLREREARGGPGIPLGRLGRLAEVGHAAVFLASEAAAYITGQTLCVDGGRTLL